MNARVYEGQLPPRSCIQSRFCSFMEGDVEPGVLIVRRGWGVVYLIADGSIVLDPFSRDGSEVATWFDSMPEGVEILGEEE